MSVVFLKKTTFKKHWQNNMFPTTEELLDLKEIFSVFLPYLFILLSTQSVLSVERYLASNLEVGTIAGLNYAYRIAQFPVWVFVAAVSVVIFPSMSKLKGLGHDEYVQKTFTKALWMVLVITVPLSISLYFLREPIIAILLQRGAFNHHSLHVTAGILSGYSLTIVGQGMVVVGLRFFMAQGQMIRPLLIFIMAAMVNIGADLLLVNKVGSEGLGYGAAAGAFINAGMIYYFIQKELNINLKRQVLRAVQIISVNIPVVVVVLLNSKLWDMISDSSNYVIEFAYALFVALLVLAVYYFSIRHFKIM